MGVWDIITETDAANYIMLIMGILGTITTIFFIVMLVLRLRGIKNKKVELSFFIISFIYVLISTVWWYGLAFDSIVL